MPQSAEAGRRGPDVRSDCWVRVTPKRSGGRKISVKSKVESMYGEAIRAQAEEGLEVLGVAHATVDVEDAGALPFVLMARLETAARRAYGLEVAEPWLPEAIPASRRPGEKERFRRSRLYLPGNEPKFALNAGLHGADGIILDLEDSVAPAEKDAARILVRNALRTLDFGAAERMVRINQLPLGFDDLDAVIPENVHLVLIPKCESPQHVEDVDAKIRRIKGEGGRRVYLMPIIESALGVLCAFEIATASVNVVALTIGLEDYTADIGTQRTEEGLESRWARSMVVNAARAAGIAPIDSVYSDVANEDGLRRSVVEAKQLGFEGKGCIHPGQIRVIHEAFAPSEEEIDKATRIVTAFEDADAKGLAVVALGSKMIDPPVVRRAHRTVDHALRAGLLAKDWREAQ
ncbi:MAG: citrate lyase ACP [Candidatus Eisenbacteria bacterium]|nr:citrate lyase ACP [Candidatus Latescibacterota bacterium]MBD3302109.1 citrate lyase ACP [Candidatus Eisenbacteria bacterium]